MNVAPAPAALSDAELATVSVRLRIEDPEGWSVGSGTLIDARQGEALILTCGHIFRESKGKGRIEVDLFGANAGQRIPGRLRCYDLDRDVGLVCIRVAGAVRMARVAPPGLPLRVGDAIATVGCDHGGPPLVRHTRVTALGKYLGPSNLAGVANVEIAEVPQVGRSGGGLFTADGLVIGVCNAADHERRRALCLARRDPRTTRRRATSPLVWPGDARRGSRERRRW